MYEYKLGCLPQYLERLWNKALCCQEYIIAAGMVSVSIKFCILATCGQVSTFPSGAHIDNCLFQTEH